MKTVLNYVDCVNYLYNIPRFTKKAPLAQTEDFLLRLGVDLSMRTPKIIHVAGTNGKGSVCAYLDAILRADGYRTGLFTSPHLVRPEERIRIDGKDVSEEIFLRCFEKVYPVAEAMERDGAGHPAFFSFVLGMAMVAFSGKISTEQEVFPNEDVFSRKEAPGSGVTSSEKVTDGKNEEMGEESPLDYIILETGMGGRLDNTNVFRHPALTVITKIGLDHTQYLGDTREAIAAEKAGILKPDVPTVYLEDPVSAPVIEKRAGEMGCPCRKVDTRKIKILEKGREGIRFSVNSFPGRLTMDHAPTGHCDRGEGYNTTDFTSVTDKRSVDSSYRIPFAAEYQTENAALAIAAAGELGCSETAIRAGLRNARWPGRMQEVGNGFYVDGAHNADGVRALLSGLDDLAGKWTGRRILLFGAVQDKDYEEMFRELVRGFRPDLVVLAGLKTPRGVPVEELARTADRQYAESGINIPEEQKLKAGTVGRNGEKIRFFPAVREALNFARGEKTAEDFLLCAGSLYLAGEVLEILQLQEKVRK